MIKETEGTPVILEKQQDLELITRFCKGKTVCDAKCDLVLDIFLKKSVLFFEPKVVPDMGFGINVWHNK